jgi:hypothetical protein
VYPEDAAVVRAAVDSQAAVRAWLARKQAAAEAGAATTVQARWRGRLARRYVRPAMARLLLRRRARRAAAAAHGVGIHGASISWPIVAGRARPGTRTGARPSGGCRWALLTPHIGALWSRLPHARVWFGSTAPQCLIREVLLARAMDMGLTSVRVRVRGWGWWRYAGAAAARRAGLPRGGGGVGAGGGAAAIHRRAAGRRPRLRAGAARECAGAGQGRHRAPRCVRCALRATPEPPTGSACLCRYVMHCGPLRGGG